MPTPRLRTISQAYAELRASDPNTSLNYRDLMQIVKNKKIPCIPTGKKKFLIDMGLLYQYLSCYDSGAVRGLEQRKED